MNKALIAAIAAFSLSGCLGHPKEFADQGCFYGGYPLLYARFNSHDTKPFMGRVNNVLAHMSEDQIVTKLVDVFKRNDGTYFLLIDDCSIIPIEKELVDYGMGS